jgi:hypothetical protein
MCALILEDENRLPMTEHDDPDGRRSAQGSNSKPSRIGARASRNGENSMPDHWERSADHTWADAFEPKCSIGLRLLIIGACALVSWGFVILVGVRVLRLFGY